MLTTLASLALSGWLGCAHQIDIERRTVAGQIVFDLSRKCLIGRQQDVRVTEIFVVADDGRSIASDLTLWHAQETNSVAELDTISYGARPSTFADIHPPAALRDGVRYTLVVFGPNASGQLTFIEGAR